MKQPVLVKAGVPDLQVPVLEHLPPIEAALRYNPSATFTVYDHTNHMLQPAKTGSPTNYGKIDTTPEPSVLQRIA